jgi:hypothetical protein
MQMEQRVVSYELDGCRAQYSVVFPQKAAAEQRACTSAVGRCMTRAGEVCVHADAVLLLQTAMLDEECRCLDCLPVMQ